MDLLAPTSHGGQLQRAARVRVGPAARVSVVAHAGPEASLEMIGDKRLDAHPERFGARVAENLLGGRVPQDDPAGGGVGDDDRLPDSLKEFADAQILRAHAFDFPSAHLIHLLKVFAAYCSVERIKTSHQQSPFGNPAASSHERPVALRPRLAAGLPFFRTRAVYILVLPLASSKASHGKGGRASAQLLLCATPRFREHGVAPMR